jgi:hypothetical protein
VFCPANVTIEVPRTITAAIHNHFFTKAPYVYPARDAPAMGDQWQPTCRVEVEASLSKDDHFCAL